MRSKKIKFKTTDANFYLEIPKPASKLIPEWYKETSRISDRVETVKACMPFLDAITAGYYIVLGADVYFKDGEVQEISKLNMVSGHYKNQIGEFKIPEEYSDQPLKWNNFFIVETPKGYSSMICHPMNRLDLPFYTLSGVVETDTFPAPISFPFFVKKDFDGIIPEGTPIAQVIPFKRQDWNSEVEDRESTAIPVSFLNNAMNPPFNFYKRKFWKRKKYQ